ncbi:MAG: alcohol dehydrogenase catalytic domain-containing protein [Acidimicrobiaceae bacterium]|nr:alcohol dehydrogenase catalytic domain-containing protein [Acidimicrobiaceae bacterium]MYD05779.1 alcohol dehydrogenase catalytic domain-containing protein [Acidimicrobiaceae bacterium]MYI59248.1 alcohol dehydrogenase catalytic domain-containing protein [Acidimicrobiaceae bacterium]
MRAALLTAGRSPLEIVEDVDIEEPRANEVLIKISHSGICHSDTTVQDGGYSIPTILGHEASGVVEMLGSGVTHLAVGDHVVLTPLAPCGHCAACARHEATECTEALAFATNARPDGTTPFSRNGAPVWRGLGVGAFAEYNANRGRRGVQHRQSRKGCNCGCHGPRWDRPSHRGRRGRCGCESNNRI